MAALRVSAFPGVGNTSGSFFGRRESLPSLLTQYLYHHKIENHSPLTIRDYKDELEAFFRFLESQKCSMDPLSVDRNHVRGYLDDLQRLGRAPTTVNRAFGNVRAFFRWLVDEDVLETAPTAKLKAPKVPKVIKPELSDSQLEHLLSLCPQNTYFGARRFAMFRLLRNSGVRLGELAGLDTRDVEWDYGRIKVWGKGAKERHVPFDQEAQRALWRYTQYRKDDLNALWVGRDDAPMTYGSVQADLYRMFDRAGYRGVLADPVHIFRRTWALNLLRDGMDIANLRVLGGWESLEVIVKHYLPLLGSEDALAAYNDRGKRRR
jgi:site-specific recombinase XerD